MILYYIIYYTLYNTIHYILYTLYSILYTICCILYTIYSVPCYTRDFSSPQFVVLPVRQKAEGHSRNPSNFRIRGLRRGFSILIWDWRRASYSKHRHKSDTKQLITPPKSAHVRHVRLCPCAISGSATLGHIQTFLVDMDWDARFKHSSTTGAFNAKPPQTYNDTDDNVNRCTMRVVQERDHLRGLTCAIISMALCPDA